MESTRDYTKFKDVVGNRDLSYKHVEALIQAIRNRNLLQYFPILCNEHMQVIDGQHRLEAGKTLGLKVYYAVIPGLTLDDVMSINTNSRSWTIFDFIHAHIKNGKPQYQVLLDFSRENDIPIFTSSRLVHGADKNGEPSISAVVKSGKLTLSNIEEANKIAAQLSDLIPYCDFRPKHSPQFIYAIAALDANPAFDFNVLMDKLKASNKRILGRNLVQYYLIQIEEIYNFHNQQFVDIYASTRSISKHRVIPKPEEDDEDIDI